LVACRAAIFAALVDDPTDSEASPAYLQEVDSLPIPQMERPHWGSLSLPEQRLRKVLAFLEKLAQWQNSDNVELLNKAYALIRACCHGEPPEVYDPFCGGGSIPLEALRLGLRARGSDLNPVPVLITKALIELPGRYAHWGPVSAWKGEGGAGKEQSQGVFALLTQPEAPQAREKASAVNQRAADTGLVEDVAAYGRWMLEEAKRRLEANYPAVELPDGQRAEVVAWIWARTVRCPNPACGVEMPLTTKGQLSKKTGRRAWIEVAVPAQAANGQGRRLVYTVYQEGRGAGVQEEHGAGWLRKPLKKTVDRNGAICIACDHKVSLQYVRAEAQAGRMGAQLIAMVAGHPAYPGRIYLSPTEAQERAAKEVRPQWMPEETMNPNTPTLISGRGYGIQYWHEIFTPRQLAALTTFCDLLQEAYKRIEQEALKKMADSRWRAASRSEADTPARHESLPSGCAEEPNSFAKGYAAAVCTYLAFAVDKLADRNNSLCSWDLAREGVRNAFARQALPMVWDFAEANPIGDRSGSFEGALDYVVQTLKNLPVRPGGAAYQANAVEAVAHAQNAVVVTDPPYYDNISYADLSDFFYVWLRRMLGAHYPQLFRTLLVPKAEELVADPARHGGKEKAKAFFEQGMRRFFTQLNAHPDFPIVLFYAYKQMEEDDGDELDGEAGHGRSGAANGSASTGWETFLQGLVDSGYQITATWPMRTELSNRTNSLEANTLASSIVLACRKRPAEARVAAQREFLEALRTELKTALKALIEGHIAPVDLAQAAIGPGMAIYSRYREVRGLDGRPIRVREALQRINQMLDEVLSETEGQYDAETGFCLKWFDQYGFTAQPYGQADVLARARNVGLNHLQETQLVEAEGGRVRLRTRFELVERTKLSSRLSIPPSETVTVGDVSLRRETVQRLPLWGQLLLLLWAHEKEGDEGAAKLLVTIGREKSDGLRDLAYACYSASHRKPWSREAIIYNQLITAWESVGAKANNLTGNLI